MALTFFQPAFLIGAAAAAVPVIIHLIHRRRALLHRFPAVRFLLLADKRTARKFRLHQWLLLALRMLILLLLALTLARPYLTGANAQAAAARPPQATVILLDNSLSMQYRDGQETRLQRAKILASRLLQNLAAQDSALVLPVLLPETASSSPLFLSRTSDTWQEQLAAIQPSHAAMDLPGALQRALQVLQDSPVTQRRVVLLSDLTIHGWEDFSASRLPVVPEGVVFHCIRLGKPQRDSNALVVSVQVAEKPFIENTSLEVTTVVRNRSTTPLRNLRVDLWLGANTVGQQLIDLGPDEQVTVPFRMMAPAAGLHWGEVRLEGDNFSEDDRFYYAIRTVAPVHVLVVDGDPGTALVESEIFYLMNALQPRGTLGRPLFYPKPIPWEGIAQERLSDYQIIVLCNVEALDTQVRQRLYQFVVEGGGLLFFAGNRVDATRYNTAFYRSDTQLLPLALGQPIQHKPEQPMTLQPMTTLPEALSAFAGAEAMLQRSHFYRYMTLDPPDATPGVHVLLSFQDSRPLLVEKGLGRGRVLFFAATADRDWTDLPTRPTYLPLIHALVGYAAHLSTASQRTAVLLPEPLRLTGRDEESGMTVTVHTPDGYDYPIRYARDGAQTVAQFTQFTMPGVYRLTTPSNADFVAVNGTRAESNFDKLHMGDVQARFRPLPIMLEEEEMVGQTPGDQAFPTQELAGMLLVALVAVLMVENVCANRL